MVAYLKSITSKRLVCWSSIKDSKILSLNSHRRYYCREDELGDGTSHVSHETAVRRRVIAVPFVVNSSVGSRRAKLVVLRERRRSRHTCRSIPRWSTSSSSPPRGSADPLRARNSYLRASYPHALDEARRTCALVWRRAHDATERDVRSRGATRTDRTTRRDATRRPDHAKRRRSIVDDHAVARVRAATNHATALAPDFQSTLAHASLALRAVPDSRIVGTARRSSARFAHQYRSA